MFGFAVKKSSASRPNFNNSDIKPVARTSGVETHADKIPHETRSQAAFHFGLAEKYNSSANLADKNGQPLVAKLHRTFRDNALQRYIKLGGDPKKINFDQTKQKTQSDEPVKKTRRKKSTVKESSDTLQVIRRVIEEQRSVRLCAVPPKIDSPACVSFRAANGFCCQKKAVKEEQQIDEMFGKGSIPTIGKANAKAGHKGSKLGALNAHRARRLHNMVTGKSPVGKPNIKINLEYAKQDSAKARKMRADGHTVKLESRKTQLRKLLSEAKRGRPRKITLANGHSDEPVYDEVDEPNNHIINQLRKVETLRGKKPVLFRSKERVYVPTAHATKALNMYGALKKPQEKEDLLKKLHHSVDSFRRAIGDR